MPLRFANSTAEIFFRLFFALFLASAAAYLVLSFLKRRERKIAKPIIMLLLGTALVCFVPQFPVVYVSCYLMALGDLVCVKRKNICAFTAGIAIFACAQSFVLAGEVSALSYSVSLYAWFLIAFFILIFGAGGYFMRGKENPIRPIAWNIYLCFLLLNLVFAVMLLVDELVMGELYLLVGYVFYVASAIIDRVTERTDDPRREFYTALPFLIGQICIYFGLILALAQSCG